MTNPENQSIELNTQALFVIRNPAKEDENEAGGGKGVTISNEIVFLSVRKSH